MANGGYRVRGRSLRIARFNPKTSQGWRYETPDRRLNNTHRATTGPVRTPSEVALSASWDRAGHALSGPSVYADDGRQVESREAAHRLTIIEPTPPTADTKAAFARMRAATLFR